MANESRILHRTLDNGLGVILRESHDAPVTSFWVWYRVGARNETPGLTGVSHWVEHMQFKGTPTLGKGAIFGEVSRNGGYNNAMTSNDFTAYYETLPADRAGMAITIEADRMTNSLFDPEETESERTVILSERQGAENNPMYLLYEDVAGTAFRSHPYGKMVIGYEHDLRSMTRDDLYDHYRRYYSPGNAFVVAAGDFSADQMMEQIEQAFGPIPAGNPLPAVRTFEPPQLGERRVTLRRPAPTAYLRMGFKTPPGDHPDTASLLVADAILSGASGMGIAGGGPMGRSSRLYRSLVADGLARTAGSDFDFFIDPYLLMIGVTALPGVEPERIEEVVDREVDRLLAEPVPAAELERAVKQVKAQYVYSGEGVTNQAFWLGQMELIGSYQRAERFIDEIAAVTADDVQRIASTYLTRQSRTVGWLLPESNGGGGGGQPQPVAAMHRWGIGGHGAPASRAPFERVALENGAVVLGQAQPDDPSVSVRLRFEAGSSNDAPDQHGLAALTARSLLRGTTRRTFEQINEATDSLGASISVDAGQLFAELRIRCLREDLAAMLELAFEIARDPAFPESEVEKVRRELLAAIKEQDDDTRATADRSARLAMYPAGHPLRHRSIGDAVTLPGLSVPHLRAYHAARFGAPNLTVAAVGGFESMQALADLIERSLGDWNSAPSPAAAIPALEALSSIRRTETAIAGKSQADVAVLAPVLSRADPRYPDLDLGNLVLGRMGLMGRLGANVRDKQGLAYYAFSALEPGRTGSVWAARAGVDPANVDRAIAGIQEEIRRITSEPITAEELNDAKSYLTGVLPLALETNDGIANLLLSIEQFDLGLDYLDRYPALIEAITADSVLAALASTLDAGRIVIGIAGPA